MRPNLTNKERAITLILNAISAYLVFILITNQFIPTSGAETVWLMSILAYWFLSLLSAPWFLPPRDVITCSISSLLILTTMEISPELIILQELSLIRSVAIGYTVMVTIIAVAALFLHDRDQRSPLGIFAYKATGIFGSGEMLFSMPAFISIVAAYQSSHTSMVWLFLYWFVMLFGKPIERIRTAWKQYNADSAAVDTLPTIGTISRIDHPNIVRVRLTSVSAWEPNRLFTVGMPDSKQQYVVSLFTQVQDAEVVGTGLCVATADEQYNLPNGAVCSSHDKEKTASFLEKLSGAKDSRLVGFVVENSNISVIAFEVAAMSELKEGDVVFTNLSGQDVFYQIIGAETSEESFDQNPRGTHIVRAAQLGIYTPEKGFEKYSWLPKMNTPIFAASSRQFKKAIAGDREFPIGKVPSTNVDAIARIDELIEYHTAILGVTGTGKTELALDIIREAIRGGTKVFCVDFTGDYKHRLSDLGPIFPSPSSSQATKLEEDLFAVETGQYGAGKEKKVLQKGIDELRKNTEEQIDDYLTNTNENLAILELAEMSNTKASLRLTELYLSTIMDWARENRRARQILIVLEEAHTIVPEVRGSGFDFDTQFVVSRIGQIALQGRKYGVGLMVISQRTALVSKTILSQCNTFLTHSLIDQTSLNFLDSVYSSQHTKLIPNLGRFEFLASGKAIKAERPIVLKKEFDQSKLDASLALNKKLETKSGPEETLPEEAVSAAKAVEITTDDD
ncbi:MAG: ATP-binding protein [Emcibacteraceae bacterium]